MTFAEFLLESNEVSAEDLLRCVDYRRWLLPFIGTLAVNKGYMDAAQVLRAVEQCEKERRQFGEVAVERGYLTREKVKVLLTEQAEAHESLSSCLVKLGILNKARAEGLEAKYLASTSTPMGV